jgi:uncharacterized membrane protein
MMGYGGGYGYGNAMGPGIFGGLFMLLFGALFVALIVLLVVWAVRMSSGHHAAGALHVPASPPGHDEAVAIAKKRFASGEISKEQYDEIIRTLGA